MLQIFGIDQPTQTKPNSLMSALSDPNRSREVVGLIVTRLLIFAIIGAGLFFFVRLMSAGYQYMTSTGDSGKMQNATKEVSNAVIGLLIVVCAYFLAQILEVVFGIKILSI